MNRFTCWFVKVTGWLPYVIKNRPKYYYEDKSVQGRKIRGKAIVMPVHYSIYDFVSMMYTFRGRNLRCLVAEVLYTKNKALTCLLKKLGTIRVDRDERNFSFIDDACGVLDKNGVVEIYPESRLPLEYETSPLPFKPSVTYIALNSGAPIIPVVTSGKCFKGKRQKIMIGTPIDVKTLYDESLSEKENIENITIKLREKIIQLDYELQQRTSAEKAKRREKQEKRKAKKEKA